MAAAKARGVRLGSYARISKAKQEAARARYETVRKPIEATADMSANAAAIHLNDRGWRRGPSRFCGLGGTWKLPQGADPRSLTRTRRAARRAARFIAALCAGVATLPPAGKAGVLLIFDVHLVVGGAPTEEAT